MAQKFSIDGLHCQGCVDTVTGVLESLPDVSAVRVALDTKSASTVEVDTTSTLTTAQVQSALDAKGNFSVLSN